MTIELDAANKLWDEFLGKWPLDRVKSMLLSEYTNVGNKDTFTYWIESRLEPMGSIWGGSSFKFGVYERRNTEQSESGRGRSYDEKYAWYSKYGDSAEQAFEKVRSLIVQVVEAASMGDIEAIDGIDLGDAYKWKIAFHYQNRNNPKILDIFIKDPFVYFLNDSSAADKPFSYLYSHVFMQKPPDQSIFEYTDAIWDKWKGALRVWKISHGTNDFSEAAIQKHLNDKLISLHKDTAKGQGEAFRDEMRQDDLFYLCHGSNEILLVGKVISDVIENPAFEKGWIARKYEVLKISQNRRSYSDEKKGWTPNYNSTLKLIPPTELDQFESFILKPFFNTSLSELAALKTGKKLPADVVSEITKNYTPTHPTQLLSKKRAENLILYVPPGTGKTYRLTEYLKEFTTTSSAESEDSYLSRLVADKPWWQIVGAAVLDRGKARVPELINHKLVKAKLAQTSIASPNARLWATLQFHSVQDCPHVNYQRRHDLQFFWKEADSTWSVKEELLEELVPEIIELKNKSKKDIAATGLELNL